MASELNIWSLIGFIGAAQALVVGLALLTTPGLARKVLGLLLVDLGAAMGVILYSHLHPGPEPRLAGLIEVAISLLAPVLLYTFVVLVVRRSLPRGFLWHALVPAIWIVQAVVLAVGGENDAIWRPPIESIVVFQIAYTFLSAYLAWGTRIDAAVSTDALALARISVAFMALIHVAQVARMFVDTGPLRDVVPITSALVVITLTFVAARRLRVFSASARRDFSVLGPGQAGDGRAGEAPVKYSTSSLTDEQAERGLERFRHAMEEERAFLRTDLTLDRLAEELGLARTHLSQLVNERCEQPFLEVVADYRVEEAERLLADPGTGNLTVEAVGERAGFQSKSAFYAAFKKRMGVTPAEVRRTLQAASGPDRHLRPPLEPSGE